ncbi:short-chain dehydrogenase [Ophiostoma piceae UAMH 11346]|uniref:Short-chain dehydrogenase n=1 Tax=Ophiostoma piceae (strain UAMH 11346) TaxID=1262450 RepID=S3BU68_OPHP1|nr:short-chain dehydrogenase [Ophiostoma piceae UAMH 11346]
MSLPKVALVTAGSAGLGAAVARVLALELGMSVVINYSQNASRAQALVHELQKSYKTTSDGAKPSYHAIQADLSKKEDVKRLAQEAATAAGGRLDVVVSNVGWTKVRDFMNLDDGMDEEDWDSCLGVNVKSHLWLFHAARPFLEESNTRDEGGAVFVSTASVAGVKPSGSSLPYAVSKAAQIHLIKSLALIAAPTIRVNSVSPGLLMTEWGLSFPQEKIEATRQTNKLKRFATVEDVAAQIKTFVQSRTVTGQNAVIDGGFTL